MKIASQARLAVFCLCVFSLQAVVAGEPAAQGAALASTAGLRDLRKSLSNAEEKFLALYNKLNRNVDQQVSCSDSAPTGSRLSKRTCSTRAQTRANEDLARDYVNAAAGISANQSQTSAVQSEASTVAQAGTPLTTAQSAALTGTLAPDSNVGVRSGEAAGKVAQETLEFEKNLQKLLDANPELRQRYEEFLAARQQYQQAGGRL
jgi:hypothetical protein